MREMNKKGHRVLPYNVCFYRFNDIQIATKADGRLVCILMPMNGNYRIRQQRVQYPLRSICWRIPHVIRIPVSLAFHSPLQQLIEQIFINRLYIHISLL